MAANLQKQCKDIKQMSSPLNASTENKNCEHSCGSVRCVTNSTSGPSVDRGKQSDKKTQIQTPISDKDETNFPTI